MKWPSRLQFLGLLGALIGAHLLALWRPFGLDDLPTLEDIEMHGGWRLLSPDVFGFVRPGKMFLFSLYSMLFGRSFMLWNACHGLLLLATSVLLFRLARTFFSPAGAFFAALVYVTHPLHVEGTFWVSAANGTWLTFFALAYYLHFLNWETSFSLGDAIKTSGLFFLALCMKEEAIVLPFLVLLFFWGSGRPVAPRARPTLLFQFLMGLGMILVFRHLSTQDGSALARLPLEKWIMPFHAARNFWEHLWYFLFPFRLTMDFPAVYDISPQRLWTEIITSWAFLGLLLIPLGTTDAKGKAVSGLALLAFAGFLPLSNIIPVGNIALCPRYVTHIGCFLALFVAGFYDSCESRRLLKATFLTTLGCWLLLAGLCSMRFHRDWSVQERLFAQLLRSNPDPKWSVKLAETKMNQSRLNEALIDIDQGIALGTTLLSEPEDHGSLPSLKQNMSDLQVMKGIILQRQGAIPEALNYFLSLEKDLPDNPDLLTNLAWLFESRFEKSKDPQDLEKAINYYGRASKGKKKNSEIACQNLGLLLIMNHREKEGIAVWQEGLEKFPFSSGLKHNLQRAFQTIPSSPGAKMNKTP